MREIKLSARCQSRLGAPVLHIRVSVYDIGEQFLVLVVEQIAHSDDRYHISDLSQNAAEVKPYRIFLISRFVELSQSLNVNARIAVLHTRSVKLLKSISVLERIVVLGRDRACSGAYALDKTLGVHYSLKSVGEGFKNLVLKWGHKSRSRTDGRKVIKIPAKDIVKRLLPWVIISASAVCDLSGDVSLLDPFIKQLLPIAEVNCGKSVGCLIVHYFLKAFSVCHKHTSQI